MRNLAKQLQDSTTGSSQPTEKSAITGHCQMTKAGCLPLLPLSPLSASSSLFGLRMRLGKEHKLRSFSSILHRRSRSINVLINKSPSPSKNQDEERSTMSLCSVTSDEYDLEDTMMMDTLDVDFIVDSGYYQSPTTARDGRRSYHHHGAHDGISSPPTVPRVASSTLSSVRITPPTPARLTLKMRPSVFLDHDDDYHHHHHHNDELVHGDDRFCHTMDDDDLQIHEGDDDRPSQCPVLIRSESVSFDDHDGAITTDDENTAPPPSTSPPTTPLPSWYLEAAAANHLSSPPRIRVMPKNTVHLPFQSLDNDFNISGGRRRRRRHVSIDMDDEDRTLSHPMLHHLLLPDDF